MRAIFVLAVVALVSASQPRRRIPNPEWSGEILGKTSIRDIQDHQFRANREFRYVYNGQLATGIPQSSRQHAVTRIQAIVSLIFKTDSVCLMRLTHIRMGQLKGHVQNPRQVLPFQAFEEVEVSETLMRQLSFPVQFKYNHGLVSEIVFDGDDLHWSENIKRGVLNMLQVNLKQHGRTDMSEEQLLLNTAQESLTPEYDFFTSQERTLEGDCETDYTITRQPCRRCEVQVLNVTKSINFEKCRQRPDIRYNKRFGEECNSCDRKYANDEKQTQSSTVARYNITGNLDSFMIESSVVESQYMFTPVNEKFNVIATYVNQTLMLVRSGPVESQVLEPNNPKMSDSQMVFNLEWDIQKERFFMEGDQEFLKNSPYSEIKNKPEVVEQVLQRLVQQMKQDSGIEQEAPRQLSRLVKLLRMCTASELSKIHQVIFEQGEKFETEHRQTVRDLLVDAMAIAGTKNTIEHLVQMTKERKVNPVKTAISIKSLFNTRVVSEKQIELLLDLCRHQVAQKSPVLRQSCYLTAGSLINALCKDNADKLAIESKTQSKKFCPRSLKEKYTKELLDLFKQATTKYEKILALKALANAGIDLSVFELEKIIKNVDHGAPHEQIIRSQAIDALRQLSSIMPRKIQKILMPMFMNQQELPELRMTAVAQIIRTQPERPVLDQIAQQMVQERSQQVSAFVYTMLRTLANSTHECERRIAQDLQLSLRHARSIPLNRLVGRSFFVHLPLYSRELNMGATVDLRSIIANDSYLPKEVMASLSATYGGQWLKNLGEIGFVQQNGEQLIEKLLGHHGLLSEFGLDKLLTRARRSEKSEAEPRTLLRDIFEKLGIRGRRSQNLEPMALLYMRYKNMDFAMLPIDMETIPESVVKMIENRHLNLQQIERFLAQGFHLDMHKGWTLNENSRKLPTSLGVPLEVSFKAPVVGSIKGIVKVQLQSGGDKLRQLKAHIIAKPTIAAAMHTKVESWTPVVNTGLKVVETAQLHLPLDTDIELNLEREPVEIKVAMRTPKREIRILAVQARPVTYTRVWPKFVQTYIEPEEETIFGEEWDRVKTVDKKIGTNVLGIQAHIQGQWQRTPYKTLVGTPVMSFAGNNYIEVTLRPGYEPPDEVVIRTQINLFNKIVKEMRPAMENFYSSEEMKSYFDSSIEERNSKSSESQQSQSKSEESQESQEFEQNEECQQCRNCVKCPKCSKCQKKGQQRQQQINNDVARFQKFHSQLRTDKPLEHVIDVALETRGSTVPRKAQLQLKSSCGQSLRHCQWEIQISRSAIPAGKWKEMQSWVFQARGEYVFPDVPYSLKQLEEMVDNNDKFISQIEAQWGEQGQKQQSVVLKIKGSRSDLQKQLLSRSIYHRMYRSEIDNELFSPVQQYEQLLKAAALTEYKVSCDYKVSNKVSNVTNKLYNLLKYWNMWNSDVAQVGVRNPEGKILATITIDPRNYQYVNVSAKLPEENIRLTDVSVPVPLMPLNLRRMSEPIRSVNDLVQSVSGRMTNTKCKVLSDGRIETFDDSSYPIPITTCYSVLAKDCSGYEQPKFAVLMKKMSSDSSAKKIKVITLEKVIVMEARQSKYMSTQGDLVKVKINDQEINVDDEETLVEHGLSRKGSYITLNAPEVGLQVAFDGYAATVKLSQMYRNAQCGLCGHFDGERLDEWRTADNELTDDVQRFHRSYFHRDEECTVEENVVSNLHNYNQQPAVWDKESSSDSDQERSASRSDEKISRESSSSEEETESAERRQLRLNNYRQTREQPQQQTKVIEYAHELCFSKKPVPVCPKNTFVSEFEEDQKVSFCCLPRTTSEAHSLHRLARQGKIVQTDALKPSFVETVLIPKRCTQL